ncbi:uncharacterized protein TRIVIDRAFT_225704 [Trichoderma virens Gv29-8]|uniref:2EXR domain-containing protein n=1 Tax=Hypocrea virens (strain Gv29-8 / FGSC 10586) TaxID=413071 RepID=G9N462_HYPVG|nr:uncharacterized protein TRIVIDRAFT_225704 [Trichoderma virens Gv29-8]EHK18388.1 hypothetical protein TRIVIDRAFT_225704 [Trichoderma virens Gv29-8]UKZ52602.1 hypothetical protein TrVGV298_006383 [Trichoderma virens]
MSTFHPFPRLPIELRIRIWNLTAFPRIVRVRTHMRRRWVTVGETLVQYVASSTPCPPVMQVCHESRQHAPYEQAYTNGFEPRYIWINFETDMICLEENKDPLSLANPLALDPHEEDIQRLRFSINKEADSEWFFHFGNQQLSSFSSVKEIHLAVDRKIAGFSVSAMADTVEYCLGRYADIVKFLDVGSGLMMDANQVRLTHAWITWHSFERYGKAKLDTFEEDMRWMQDDDTILTLSEIHVIEDGIVEVEEDESGEDE